ncbi:unnamed protein product, partial [Symbiodinium sp. KB8]
VDQILRNWAGADLSKWRAEKATRQPIGEECNHTSRPQVVVHAARKGLKSHGKGRTSWQHYFWDFWEEISRISSGESSFIPITLIHARGAEGREEPQ